MSLNRSDSKTAYVATLLIVQNYLFINLYIFSVEVDIYNHPAVDKNNLPMSHIVFGSASV
jgi:hypothetical protein